MFKHAVLFSVLQAAARAPRPWLYIETHAAAGRYDLTGSQARKTGEAEAGVVSLLKDKTRPAPLADWLGFVEASTLQAYPGSPAIAQHCLREQDRMIFFEQHPGEYDKLGKAVDADARCRAIKADGYNDALKLQPRRNENLLVFLDPSYETERDMDALANWLPRAMKRWPKATFLVWMPLFADERELEFGQYVSSLGYGFVAGARWAPEESSALEGSAMIGLRTSSAMARPAYEIAEALDQLWSG